MKKKVLPRVFFDIEIAGNSVGRVVFQLFSDVCPKTTENFRCLCTGERGLGDTTGKPLHYKGVVFHRVVRDFMIQSGDFSEGNGRGGESIYGGFFPDESFEKKHDEPFLLSMANRGKNTNGSQFFVTTQPTPHLDGVHVVFGRVVTGENIIKKIEAQPTDANSRPKSECKIVHCGELVLARTKKVKGKKKKDAVKDSDDSSDSSNDDASESDEGSKKKKKDKKKKKKHKKERKKKKNKIKEDSSDENTKDPDSARTVSSIKADEVPPVPEQKFLLRGDQTKKDEVEKKQESVTPNSARSQGRLWRTKSGRKVKGRGVMRYRTPSRSRSRSPYRSSRRSSFRSRHGSETPPHWREAQRGQRPLKDVTTRSLESPESGRWRKTSRSPSDANTHRRNHRVTSPWASDEDLGLSRRHKESLSEGEWSDDEYVKNDSKEYEDGELREEKPQESKPLDEPISEGPALPPGFNEKTKRKRQSSAKSKSTKRRKKSRKTKELTKKTKISPELTRIKSSSVKVKETVSSVQEEPPKPVPKPVDKSPKYSAETGVIRSKWDSTDEENDSANNVTNTELPEAPDAVMFPSLPPQLRIMSGVLDEDDKLTKGKKHGQRKENKKKSKNVPAKQNNSSDSEEGGHDWEEAATKRNSSRLGANKTTKKRKISENSSAKSSPAVFRKTGRSEKPANSSVKKINKNSRQSSARLFEQARNVLLKAEAELAAIGYHKAGGSLSGRLRRRSRSYSSSRSRSRSSDRYRHRRSYERRRRTYSRSTSRSRYSRHRSYSSFSSSGSRSKSPRRRGRYSKSSGRRTSSSSRSSSGSSRSSSHSSSSSSNSSHLNTSTSQKKSHLKSKEKSSSLQKNGTNTKVTAINSQKNTNEASSSKSKSKCENAHESSKDYNPYSEKSRLRNKMHKSKTEEKVKPVVTAASVRKAEKVKKQKKLKAEKLMWQPPLEFGEEEDANMEEIGPTAKKHEKLKKAEKQRKTNSNEIKPPVTDSLVNNVFNPTTEIMDTELPEDEIDKLLSSGVDELNVKNNKTSADVFEKRAKSLMEFKKRQKGATGNIKQETFEKNNLDHPGHTEDNIATAGFGIMPKFTPKPKEIKKEPEIEEPIKDVNERHIKADLDSIWPEDNKVENKEVEKEKPEDEIFNDINKENIDKSNNMNNNNVQVNMTSPMKKEFRPAPSFRAHQYDLAREESESSESEEEWKSANLQPAKKTIKFNIKLPSQPVPTEDKNNNEQMKNENVENHEEGSDVKKKSRKHKKRKKEKKKEEATMTSFEMIAKSLRKHREKDNNEKGDGKDQNSQPVAETETETQNKTENKQGDETENKTTEDKAEKPEEISQKQETVPPNPALPPTTSQQRMPYPSQAAPYQMPMGMPMRPPGGYPFPPFPYNTMMMNMRYPMSQPPLPMPVNMPPLPDADNPPLPKENFPPPPPEPKKKSCKLSDTVVTDLFKKKNISSERLSTLLAEDDEKEVRLPSPAPSLEERKPRHRQRRSYRGRHNSSSDSYSSDSSRSSSRSRGRSRRSRSIRSGSRRSRSSTYDSYYSSSDRSRSSHKCRHRSRSSSSYDSYSSRSKSRSSSRERHSSRRRRSHNYSSDSEYSSRSRSRSRSYSRSRSKSRRRSHGSRYED